MQIATRSQYVERSMELASIAAKFAKSTLVITLALVFANFAGFTISGASVFLGLTFALALPLIIAGVATEQGAPTFQGVIAGQLAMLGTIYFALTL